MDKTISRIGFGKISLDIDPSSPNYATHYTTALENASINLADLAKFPALLSGQPHYKIDGDYYAPCIGDTSVFYLPRRCECDIQRLCGYMLGAIGDLVVHDKRFDHFHMTCRGFGTTSDVNEGAKLSTVYEQHHAKFDQCLERVKIDPATPNTFKLKFHDISLLDKDNAIAIVVRHQPISNEDGAGLYRVFRNFDEVAQDGDIICPTWHTTLGYRLTRPFTVEEAKKFAECLGEMSSLATQCELFELSIADLVYWQFTNMDDFHEVE